MTEKEIKPNLNRVVAHVPSGTRYKLTGATIHRDEQSGEFWYQAELQDLSAPHSIRICRLTDIEIVKD